MMLSKSEKVFHAIVDARGECQIDLPNTDAVQICRNWQDVEKYIAAFGDQEVWPVDYARRLSVPAFKAGQDAAIAAKLAYCDKYGSE